MLFNQSIVINIAIIKSTINAITGNGLDNHITNSTDLYIIKSLLILGFVILDVKIHEITPTSIVASQIYITNAPLDFNKLINLITYVTPSSLLLVIALLIAITFYF